LIAFDSRLVGLIALQDVLRPGAKQAVERLGAVGLEPVLLSGDARQTCENVAAELGVEHIRPEILPADRGAEVRALGEGGHVVAVLGRASEDDGALGAADVSVALASAGASPGEWTVSLASEDVRDAALALALAKRVHERARLAMISGFAAAGAGVLTLSFALAPLWIAPLAAFAGSLLAWRIVVSAPPLGAPPESAELGSPASPVSARGPLLPPKNPSRG
jgi:P-type E1-E2 ATPase